MILINSIAEIASGIVCGCLITMPHFFRHFAPKIASKLSLSRSTGASKLLPFAFVPVRASKVPEWSSGAYESAATTTRGNKDEYMELGESNTWRGPATTIVHVDDDGAVRGRDEWGGRATVENLQSNVSSVYEDDYPRADGPRLVTRPVRR